MSRDWSGCDLNTRQHPDWLPSVSQGAGQTALTASSHGSNQHENEELHTAQENVQQNDCVAATMYLSRRTNWLPSVSGAGMHSRTVQSTPHMRRRRLIDKFPLYKEYEMRIGE